MKILAINAGSSSLKFQVFQMPEEEVVAKGPIEELEWIPRGFPSHLTLGKSDFRSFGSSSPCCSNGLHA
jgi:acetate kinase